MNNCPHCGARGCFDFVKEISKGTVVSCCSCGNHLIIPNDKGDAYAKTME